MGIKEELALLNYDDLEAKINRLIRERDEMGPVNLRAEIEMEELEEQISNILKESEDLESAINKLRDGIKKFSNWPTIPQLYVKEEFVGGCDIIREMFESGELKKFFNDNKIELLTE